MCCKPSAEWEARAASSANGKSLIMTDLILVFTLSLEILNGFPSDLVRRRTPSVESPKACLGMTTKKMPKKVGASTQPCFTPLGMPKTLDEEASNCTTPFMSVWKE